jgi:hypothetical protein
MRAMRSFGSAVALGALLVAGAFAACVSSPPTPPPPTVADEASSEAAVPTASAASVPRAEAPAPPTTAEAGAKTAPPPSAATAPLDVARCNRDKPDDLRVDIANEPDGGTCMNNAMTSADAGSTDRCSGVLDAIRARRDAFRCCYGLYARAHQSGPAHVVLHVELAPDGKVTKASLDEQRSSVAAPDLERCMATIATTLSFPRSPSGRDTKLNYPFDFEPTR